MTWFTLMFLLAKPYLFIYLFIYFYVEKCWLKGNGRHNRNSVILDCLVLVRSAFRLVAAACSLSSPKMNLMFAFGFFLQWLLFFRNCNRLVVVSLIILALILKFRSENIMIPMDSYLRRIFARISQTLIIN